MPPLIPSPETIMQMLRERVAFREGHFVHPSGKHTAHYFQMPLRSVYYGHRTRTCSGAKSKVSR